MGGNADYIAGYGYISLQRALDIARASDDGRVDPTINAYLERKLGEVWARVQAQPSSYVFTKEEFSLFNYYRARFGETDPIVVGAIARFWNRYHGGGGGS
ncbi:uncharacterized protein BDR25DRAFT_72900 [Lindgomyces ingoldianus]|uniref:Uncharacterized protein n=1 Tax=Lindgomyces ingoldianus TaxID=673940 RepID=A0ACB6QKL8_9PLEO|nr:uncharacterized protein BDR25DRAFT_72900 [Lindgomyces ingoldianus]KAF2467065.1 hypothetical protein BDR25DRAFT_72900 [Lindgomyces ingoldianus]